MGNERISFDAYAMVIAAAASLMSTCERASVGCVLVKNKRVIATGYNGAPPGMRHCTDGGCLIYQAPGEDRERCINTVHAEVNALVQSRGEVADTVYCTHEPCLNCLKALLSYNPRLRIVCLKEYVDATRQRFVDYHGIELQRLDDANDLEAIRNFTGGFLQ